MPKDFTERTAIRERILPFSNLKRGWNKIERESKRRVQKAETAESIFSHALGWLFCEDADEGTSSGIPDTMMAARNRQISALHARIDQRFFDRLFEAPDMKDEERQTFWETILVEAFQTQFKHAKELCPNKHRWKRLAKAQSIVDNRARAAFTYANQFDNESAYA
jgi:CRISPR system Cascade subunit CasA